MKIGVLALQGAFIEHIHILENLGANAISIRLPDELDALDGLIIPGGESTTIGKLMVMYDFVESLSRFAQKKPLWGTCAGMILMAKDIGRDQPVLEAMDIVVERNAFGRQQQSFEEDLYVGCLQNGKTRPFHGVFIRSPKLRATRGRAKVIARLADGTPVAAIEHRMLATSFHPELTDDPRFHHFFLSLIMNR